MVDTLNKRFIPPERRGQAMDALRDGNALAFLFSSFGSQCYLDLVSDNVRLLKARGIYEKCLLTAFTCTRTNNHRKSIDELKFLFDAADVAKLRAAGDPLPSGGPFCIFRGIAGRGRARRLRGFSWTGNFQAACWFALRLELAHPAVLTANVRADQVLAYVHDNGEQEFVCQPHSFERRKLSQAELLQASNRWATYITSRSGNYSFDVTNCI